MKNLKLEVGKTYLNRKGERVQITRYEKGSEYAFLGDDSGIYTSTGNYWNDGRRSSDDLIAEAPTAQPEKRTFKIPENTREISVSETDGRIVIEFVPEERFKAGDIVVESGRIMIVKSYPSAHYANMCSRIGGLSIGNEYGRPFTAKSFRLATPAEAQQLFDALAKDGKRWNPETLKIEELTERDRIAQWLKKAGWTVSDNRITIIEEYVKHREAQRCK